MREYISSNSPITPGTQTKKGENLSTQGAKERETDTKDEINYTPKKEGQQQQQKMRETDRRKKNWARNNCLTCPPLR